MVDILIPSYKWEMLSNSINIVANSLIISISFQHVVKIATYCPITIANSPR